MDAWQRIDARLRIASNREIVAYLDREQPYAHSDLAEALVRAAVPGMDYFCPAPGRYAYLAAFLPNLVIVAVAEGMQAVLIRVRLDAVSQAVAQGATLALDVGTTWVRLAMFSGTISQNTSRALLATWLCDASRD
jgi:hypothetical protein